MLDSDRRIPLKDDGDIVFARQEGRDFALRMGFASGDATVISTSISEIARNIVSYAGRGEIRLNVVERGGRRGIQVVGSDEGPGIKDVEGALQDGYSTSGGLGLGLPGSRRLMDEFEILTEPGRGTVVTMRKWER